MSESDRISRRRNITVFTNYVNRGFNKPDNIPSYDFYNILRVGAVETGLIEPNIPAPLPGSYNLMAELYRNLNLILTYAANNNLGPTKSSRYYYLWFFSVATAYQWISGSHRVNGNKDNWNWDVMYSLGSEQDICIWMLSALETINSNFSIVYNAPWDELQATYLLNSTQLAAARQSVKAAAAYDVWSSAYATWWSGRAADGNVAAAVPPADADLPNGSMRLDVALTVDPATFSYPEAWTPLKIGAASQKYLTYEWNNVISAALTAGDQTTVFSAANAFYPTNVERAVEIDEVVTITNNLDDTQKVTAEFWAGGPFTVSPPGMLIWMWKHYVFNKFSDPALFIWSGLDLSLHLFETGRIVWGLKKLHMEARPIQEIRRLYRGVAVKKYDGSNILGESWVPYQETDFVTPPFADFPSGHSAFSRSFKNVMTAWFGASIDTSIVVNYADINLISPSLRAQVKNYGEFNFGIGDSLIQNGIVPSAPIVLSWTNWQDMAESAGLSRKYGGIHATSAHTGSVAAADSIHVAINFNFPISLT